MTERDRRALILLALTALPLIAWWALSDDGTPATVAATQVESIPVAEQRLARLRQVAAAVPGKEQALEGVKVELGEREKGLMEAETAAQAQAQLLQIVRKLARQQVTPIELRNTEIGAVKPFGEMYGEVAVSVNFESGIEQLINFLSDLTAQKEAIGTTDLRIGAANPKQKTMPVRLTISGLVRRDLVPKEKSGAAL